MHNPKTIFPTTKSGRVLSAFPDLPDFRDKLFVPTLIDVPEQRSLANYLKVKVPILDQGTEGACTGYGLAAVVNFLLRTRTVQPHQARVSPKMLYQLARRYDEWSGENYEGSSARGAMKGWHKHGVCEEDTWNKHCRLAPDVIANASGFPLGAYFRVDHKDLVAMHSAIAEVGIVYATADVHSGWDAPDNRGIIMYNPIVDGGHAFAIVGYDSAGFWVQNSWGPAWGYKGFGHISYEEWLSNATDVWVARLGVPMKVNSVITSAKHSTLSGRTYSYSDLRPHIISLGNNGALQRTGEQFATSSDELRDIVQHYIPQTTASWKRKRILLYAHGGLVDEDSTLSRLNDVYGELLNQEIYPLWFVWRTGIWETLSDMLKDIFKSRGSGHAGSGLFDKFFDITDSGLEALGRPVGKPMWSEMKENGSGASGSKGGATLLLNEIASLIQNPAYEIHLACHSAGSILLGAALPHFQALNIPVSTCTLWAPACRVDLFIDNFKPLIPSLKLFSLFTLTDRLEQDDDCAGIYRKSLLYLISNAFEDSTPLPFGLNPGTPILGMEKFIRSPKLIGSKSIDKFLNDQGNCEWIRSDGSDKRQRYCTTARHHGGFDDDNPTWQALVCRIRGEKTTSANFTFNQTASSRKRDIKRVVRR